MDKLEQVSEDPSLKEEMEKEVHSTSSQVQKLFPLYPSTKTFMFRESLKVEAILKSMINKSFRSFRQLRGGPVGQSAPLAQSSTSRQTSNLQMLQQRHRQQQHQQQLVALPRHPLLLLQLHLQSQQHRLDIKIYHHQIAKVIKLVTIVKLINISTGYCSIRFFWIDNPIQIHHK